MTDNYGPFNGAPWYETEWYDFAPSWASSGVIGTRAVSATSGEFAFAATGLSVSAGTGRAWVRGAGLKRTGTVPTHAVTANAHASWSRRDRLVLRRDLPNKTVTTAVVPGGPAASPASPALTQVEAGIWEVPLFSFLVPPNNGTTISGVVDERTWIGAGLSWRTPTLSGFNQDAFGRNFAYARDADGFVHFRGFIANQNQFFAPSGVIFTLDTDDRPTQDQYLTVFMTAAPYVAIARITAATGQVLIALFEGTQPAGIGFGFDGVSYYAKP